MASTDYTGRKVDLAAVTDAQSRLERFYDVKYFAFDKSAEPIEPDRLTLLRPVGEATYLDVALATIGPAVEGSETEGSRTFSTFSRCLKSLWSLIACPALLTPKATSVS